MRRRILFRLFGFSGIKRRRHWKEAWVYSVGDNNDARYILSHLRNHLIVKKVVAKQALCELTSRAKEIEDGQKLRDWRRQKARALRKKGLAYRHIGSALNMDFGYARRLILFD